MFAMKQLFTEKGLESPGRLAKMLNEYNLWRRGVGKYAWSEDPKKNVDFPFSSSQLTMILNASVCMLERLASRKVKGEQS